MVVLLCTFDHVQFSGELEVALTQLARAPTARRRRLHALARQPPPRVRYPADPVHRRAGPAEHARGEPGARGGVRADQGGHDAGGVLRRRRDRHLMAPQAHPQQQPEPLGVAVGEPVIKG